MAKQKKYQLVEIYLNNLVEREDFTREDLEELKTKDISNARELEGIGGRTISNVLNDFKTKKGIQPSQNKATKKHIVEEYLERLAECGGISHSELMRISYNDLKDVEELAEVGKTTVTCALAEFKQINDRKAFEKGVLDFLAQEKSTTDDTEQPVLEHVPETAPIHAVEYAGKAETQFSGDNVRLLKKMINEFKYLKSIDEEKKLFELRELKHALHYVGINPSKIIRLYWEDMSKDFMNRKILSGQAAIPTDLKVSGFM